jgi:RimJ/RimL family protein N-acetyltransferase
MNFDFELVAENLILRQLNPSDVTDQYIEWLNDKEINQFLEVRTKIPSLTDQKEYIEKCLKSTDTFMLGISKPKNGLIGSATLRILPMNRLSVGLMIGEKSFHGKGIGRQVISLVINWATEQGFSAIEAGYDTRNLASNRLFKGLGFEVVRELPAVRMDSEPYIIQTSMLTIQKEGGTK